MNERLKIALPSGELESDVLGFMKNIGLEFNRIDRRYFIPVDNMPIDFIVIRASEIPGITRAEQSVVKAGITGSDIIWEAGIGIDAGEEMPVLTLNPSAKQSALFIGITEDFAAFVKKERARKPEAFDLTGGLVATKYPYIASGILRGKDARNVTVMKVGGTDEAMQYAYPDCIGIVGTISSGDTTRANGIEVLDVFYDVTTRMIQAANKLSSRDADLLDDLREKIAVAIQKKRMV